MTILVVILLGFGTVLIASSLDNTPIVTTFQKIINGDKLDWTGNATDPMQPKSIEDTPQDVKPKDNGTNGVA